MFLFSGLVFFYVFPHIKIILFVLTSAFVLFQFRKRQEVGGRARHAEEQQPAADQRAAGVHGQRGGVEAPVAQLQGGERPRQGALSGEYQG